MNTKSSDSSAKVSIFNDFHINSLSLTNEISKLKQNTISNYTPEFMKIYSILFDVYEILKLKDQLNFNEKELLKQIRIF